MTGEPDRPLFGPEGRIPVAAEAVVAPHGLAAVRAGWTRFHTVLAALASPVMFAVYRGAAGEVVTGWAWYLAVAVAGVLAALLVALYLPLRGLSREPISPCYVMPIAMIVAAGVLFSQGASPFTATVALALLTFAVVRRATGLNAC